MKKTRRSKTGFTQFLLAQQHRTDKVGIVARAFATKRHWLQCLLFGPDPEILRTGAVRAMVEYDKLVKKAAR